MGTQTQGGGTPSQQDNGSKDSGNGSGKDDDTFTTDISETDDEGTTVREAEVSKEDLQEKNPPKGS